MAHYRSLKDFSGRVGSWAHKYPRRQSGPHRLPQVFVILVANYCISTRPYPCPASLLLPPGEHREAHSFPLPSLQSPSTFTSLIPARRYNFDRKPGDPVPLSPDRVHQRHFFHTRQHPQQSNPILVGLVHDARGAGSDRLYLIAL